MMTPAPDDLATKGMLAAIADGVSGKGGGREAAEYTVRGLLTDYYATPDTWEIPVAIDRVLNAINRWLLAQGTARPEFEGMATTLTALVLRRQRYWLAHVGDTRAYLLRHGTLTRLTADHVWDRPDMQHVLTRALGLDPKLSIDYLDGDLEAGDVFVLASDGVWEPLRDARMHVILATSASPEDAARALCEAALAAGSTDNLSAIVLRVNALPAPDLQDAAGSAAALPVPSRLKPGAAIDGFHVVKLLHESRAALLYQVRDDASGHLFVLKALHPDLADDAGERSRFAHEEWLARRLNARHFAHYVPIPPARRSCMYFVMSWHPGTTLQQQLDADHHFTIPEVVLLGTTLARGLGALHRRSIVHREIEPSNLHVGDDGELRIFDLGIALSGQDAERTATEPVGTPAFLAPEQFAGAPASARTDLYAAGVTLYHLLTRRYPYGEIESLQRPRFGAPTPPSRFRPDVPPWLENVLQKAVARDPGGRFETAEELLLALERGASRPIAAPRPMPLARRDPVRFWQGVAVVSLLVNLLLLSLLAAP